MAVDLLVRVIAIFARVNVAFEVLHDFHTRDVPGQHRVPVVVESARAHQRVDFLHRRRKVCGGRAVLDHADLLRREVRRELQRLPGVIGDIAHRMMGRIIENV